MKFISKLLSAFIVLLFLAHPVYAQTDPTPEEVAGITKAAGEGNLHATFQLGLMQMMGKGMPSDPKTGVATMTKAAEQGHEQAQFMLGLAYGTDVMGLPADPEKSKFWLTKAAAQGNKKAKMMLTALENAPPPETLEQVTAKAEAGDKHAQYTLWGRYSNGWGTEKNMEVAQKWLTKSAEQGDPLAMSDLGLVMMKQNKNEDALKWMTKAAEAGVVHSQFELATVYHEGKITPNDFEKAAFWYKKAAAQGDKRAMAALAGMAASNPAPSPQP